jgi:hypothetical protein
MTIRRFRNRPGPGRDRPVIHTRAYNYRGMKRWLVVGTLGLVVALSGAALGAASPRTDVDTSNLTGKTLAEALGLPVVTRASDGEFHCDGSLALTEQHAGYCLEGLSIRDPGVWEIGMRIGTGRIPTDYERQRHELAEEIDSTPEGLEQDRLIAQLRALDLNHSAEGEG